MRNILEKSCRQNQNIHFMLNNIFFFENRAVYEIMSKYGVVTWSTNDVTIWHTRCMMDKQGYMHARACTRPRARAQLCTCAHAHTRTNMQYLLLFHGNNDSRTRLSVTLYVHCLCCFTRFSVHVIRTRRLRVSHCFMAIFCCSDDTDISTILVVFSVFLPSRYSVLYNVW